MKKQTKDQIKNIIKRELMKKLNKLPDSYELAVTKQAARKPLHERIFPPDLIVSNFLFQSLSTTLGKSVIEKIARTIASENFDYVHPREYTFKGTIPDNVKTLIDTMVRDIEHGKPDIQNEIQHILTAVHNPKGKQKEEQETVDLYLKKGGKEYFIEITTVKPNLKECRSFKRRQLSIIAIVKKPIIPIIGMPYNPYEPKEYKWSMPLTFFTLGVDLLIGEQFWDFLGGQGTYKELLNLFEEIKEEIEPQIRSKMENYINEIHRKN